MKPEPPKSETRHYRLDLAAKRFCMDKCDGAGKIAEVTPDKITITKPDPERENTLKIETWISRNDGTFSGSIMDRSLGFYSFSKGTCEKAPFSGLPKAKF